MMVKDKINIILADDNKIFIEGLKVILFKCPKYYLLDTCDSGIELLESPNLNIADILLLDIQIPVITGIELAKKINLKYPNLKMLALSMHIDKVFLEDIIGAGFKGFIYKPETPKILNVVIPKILSGQFFFPNNMKSIDINKKGGVL